MQSANKSVRDSIFSIMMELDIIYILLRQIQKVTVRVSSVTGINNISTFGEPETNVINYDN